MVHLISLVNLSLMINWIKICNIFCWIHQVGSSFSLMKHMSSDMGEFRADVIKVKEDITGLRDYVVPGLEIMKGDVAKLHEQMMALEGEVREVKQDVSHWNHPNLRECCHFSLMSRRNYLRALVLLLR